MPFIFYIFALKELRRLIINANNGVFMINENMTLEESVVTSIKRIALNVYFNSSNYFKGYLEKNTLVILPSFEITEVDETHDEIKFNFTNNQVRCLITWRNTTKENDNGRVVEDISLIR